MGFVKASARQMSDNCAVQTEITPFCKEIKETSKK